MLPAQFSINDARYEFDADLGICRHVNPQPFKYDAAYIEKAYNNLGAARTNMAHLRLGFLLGALDGVPTRLLDVGYGNGDFLRAAASAIPVVKGYDVPPAYPIAPIETVGCIHEESFDVVCFFDVLEHFPDPHEIKALKTRYVYVSLPFFHPELGLEWFSGWKHRKPSEHLWHFSSQGLKNFFREIGYKPVRLSTVEDTIRKNNEQSKPNILTGIFEKA